MIESSQIDVLNRRFGIVDVAQVVAGNGGLPKLIVTTVSASAEIYLHGAQVTSWRPVGAEEVLFLSEFSRWQNGSAIRGGIPICFPWFGAKEDDAQAPSHGFVRTKEWQLDSVARQTDGSVVVTCSTESDESTLHLWPHRFRLTHRVTIGPTLKVELIAHNTGSTPFQFTEALHTYFRVGDAASVRVRGLDQTAYLDKTDGFREKMQAGDVVFCCATDRAYPSTRAACELVDPTMNRLIRTEKQNSESTVVWNPWQQGAAALSDLGNDEWQQMVCVEAGNIRGAAVSLQPSQNHAMQAALSVLALESSY